MTSPPGSGYGVADDVATPVQDRVAFVDTRTVPAQDRVAPTGTRPAPVQDRAAPTGRHPAPVQDRAAPNGSSPGGTHVLTSSGQGNAHSSGSLHELQVALDELHNAITIVNGHRAQISDLLVRIRTEFDAAHDAWQSPSGATFETTTTWFDHSSRALKDLLDEMARRMRSTYDTYHAAETANTHNSGG
ncbi:WXG100 family type VII secretion target [Streptomyces sp. HPF1205]|uniref:WXG100 family type VII secretion target n=1 Tax=Streptomyces sp. HPF1205 TaxID=2873262 RepID=UPI001CEC524B|nr:WXG100 family type VII secretion target [Streptomyces sp. HPF1205]